MRLLIASDIHGSVLFASMLLERIKEEDADKIILLGDILYHGPRNDLPEGYNPKGVIALFEGLSVPVLALVGNCDSEVDDMVLPFDLKEKKLILKGERRLIFHHGHHSVSAKKGDAVFSGHTHVPLFKEEKGIYFINPGSVSIPKENSHHGYIIYEDSAVFFKDITNGEIIREEILK